MDDEQILDLYFARDEQAVAETDRKYGGYCCHVLRWQIPKAIDRLLQSEYIIGSINRIIA